MSDPRFSRRFALLLAAFFCIATFQCRPYVAPPPTATFHETLTPEEIESLCTSGNYSKGRPVICIDNATLRPNFQPAPVWDYEGSNGVPTTRPVTVHWRARRGGNLVIEFESGSNCVGPVRCDGNGQCVAQVQPLNKGEVERRCKYDVILDGRRNDPDTIVNPCCW